MSKVEGLLQAPGSREAEKKNLERDTFLEWKRWNYGMPL